MDFSQAIGKIYGVKNRKLNSLQTPLRFSATMLVLANIVPIIGVMLWGWRIFDIVFLYWAENLIVGLFNIARLVVVQPSNGGKSARGLVFEKLITIPFFTIHYGGFCLGHGVFLVAMFGASGNTPLSEGNNIASSAMGNMKFAIIGLVLSHLISFIINYLMQGEYKKTSVGALMFAPYGRVVVLHLTILLGAFAVDRFGNPIFLLTILIIGKTILDLGLHLKRHLLKAKLPTL